MPVEPNQFDDEQLAEIRKNQLDPIVHYLIVRKSLGMGAGKIAAQCSHATKMLILAYNKLDANKYHLQYSELSLYEATKEWINTSFRTVVLVADDKQWEKIKEEVRVFIVKDAGLTEVAAGSETVLSTWPMYKSQAPKIIQKLQTLK